VVGGDFALDEAAKTLAEGLVFGAEKAAFDHGCHLLDG
jgi:hypothetical protein